MQKPDSPPDDSQLRYRRSVYFYALPPGNSVIVSWLRLLLRAMTLSRPTASLPPAGIASLVPPPAVMIMARAGMIFVKLPMLFSHFTMIGAML
jgi:hypothetical protein